MELNFATIKQSSPHAFSMTNQARKLLVLKLLDQFILKECQ